MSNVQNFATLLTIWPDEYAPLSTHDIAGALLDQCLSAAITRHRVDGRQEFIRALFASLRAHYESANALPADTQLAQRKASQSCARVIVNSPALTGIQWYDIMCEFPDLLDTPAVKSSTQPVTQSLTQSDDKTASQIRTGPGVCTNMESLLCAVKAAIERGNFAEVFDYIRAIGNNCFNSMLKHVPPVVFLKLHDALIVESKYAHASVAFTPRYVKSYLTARLAVQLHQYSTIYNAWHNLAESINGEKYTLPDKNLKVSFYIRNGALKCEIFDDRSTTYTAILVNGRDVKLY